MLITLPRPGSNAPSAINIEVLRPAPSVTAKAIADPAMTSALPGVKVTPGSPAPIADAPSKSEPSEGKETSASLPSPIAAAPAAADAGPVAELAPETAPRTADVAPEGAPDEAADLPTPTPKPNRGEGAPGDTSQQLMPEATPPTEAKHEVSLEPEVKAAASPGPEVVATPASSPPTETKSPSLESQKANEESSQPPAPEVGNTSDHKPEVVRAEPNAEWRPSPAAPVAAPAKKPVLSAQAKRVKAPAKAESVTVKRRPAAAKRTTPRAHRVVWARPQTPASQGILSLFGGALRRPGGKGPANAAPRRAESTTQR
jgi:hypothetical protein